MATNVVQFSGTSVVPTQFSNQRNLDATKKNVLWAVLIDNGTVRLYKSIDLGNTWSQDSGESISSVKSSAGVDMEIARRSDGVERFFVAYIRHDQLHIEFGKLNSATDNVTWLREGVHASSSHSSWKYPSITVIPLDNNWWVHPSWVKFSSNRSYIYLTVIKFYSWNSYSKSYERYTHNFSTTTQSRSCWGRRHQGNKHKHHTGQPDIYLAWFGGAIGDSYKKTHHKKHSYSGSSWKEEVLRTVKSDTVSSGLIDSIFTGKVFVSATVPSAEPSVINLQTMNPGDTERDEIEVPTLGQGNITSLGITWDDFTGDIWIVAAGTSSKAPRLIIFEWATKTFNSWTQINTDVLQNDSISLKHGSSFNRVEMIYSIVSGSNSQVRYELVGLTNIPPTQPPFVTQTGAYDRDLARPIEWIHTDLDGDPQVQYALRRTNDAGTGFDHWNGSSWQSSFTAVTSSSSIVNLPTNWQADTVVKQYQAQTFDGQEWSQWNDPITLTSSIKENPTITSPTNLQTVISPQLTVVWTVAEQLAYLVELLSPVGAVLFTSGWVPEEDTRELELPFLLVNLAEYTVRVTTQNNEGLASDPDTVAIDALFDPPPLPIFNIVSVLESRSFLINITNPTPVGNEPETDHNNIYVDFEESGQFIRIARAIEPNGSFEYFPAHGLDTEFMVESVSADGAINQAT